MKILIVASDKQGRFAPFIEEQMTALEARGIEVLRYGITGKGILGYLRELPALRRAIRQHRPDIIHAHYGLSGLLANLQRRVPVITTYHGSDINVPAILRFSKIAMRLSAHNIFVSKRNMVIALGDEAMRLLGDKAKGTMDEVKGEKNGKADTPASTPYTLHSTPTEASTPYTLHSTLTEASTPYTLHSTPTEASTLYTLHPTPKNSLLPCGVSIPLPWSELQTQWVGQLTLNQWVHSKLNKESKYVLFAGAFDNAVKDPELAKSVIAVYNSSFANRQSPIANRQIELIELKGYNRDQVTALMYNYHALLMTSKTEGSPQVVKEAMACGCPIVSVDVGDVAERTSGVEGCYVVSTREPKDIAEALQKAIAFNGRTNARERIIAMGLSNEQVAERLEIIYENVLAGG